MRTCKWTTAEHLGMPEWGEVVTQLEKFAPEAAQLRPELVAFAEKIKCLPRIMEESGTDLELIERLRVRIREVASSLSNANGKNH